MAIDHVTSSGNVFADLGPSNPEERLVKSKLAAAFQRSIKELGLTQTAAVAITGIPQPKLSKILRGRFEGISEAYIAQGLRKLGHDPRTALPSVLRKLEQQLGQPGCGAVLH